MTQNLIDSNNLIDELKKESQLEDADETIIKSYDEYCYTESKKELEEKGLLKEVLNIACLACDDG